MAVLGWLPTTMLTSMVLPRWLARTNRRFTNRILGTIPDRISPFVTVRHVGRTTDKHYEVLLAAFSTPGGVLLTPTYGVKADWVRNVITAETFQMVRRGEISTFRNVKIVDRSVAWPHLPGAVRLAMRILGVHQFVAAAIDPVAS